MPTSFFECSFTQSPKPGALGRVQLGEFHPRRQSLARSLTGHAALFLISATTVLFIQQVQFIPKYGTVRRMEFKKSSAEEMREERFQSMHLAMLPESQV